MAEEEPALPNWYVEERKTLNTGEEGGAKDFDKAILTLAAGALGLSITFVKDIAAKPVPIANWSLAVSWIFLILSVLATLLSFQMSQVAFRRQREILDAMLTKQETDPQTEKNTPAHVTNVLNWFSLGFFVLGTALFAYFAFKNLFLGEP